MKSYRLVAVDIGNTLVRQCPERFNASLGLPPDPDHVAGIHPWRELFRDFLLGRVPEDEYIRRYAATEFGGRFTVAQCLQAHEDYLSGAFDGMPALLREMQEASQTRFVFFSDVNPIHFRAFRKHTQGDYDFIVDAVRSDEVHSLKDSPDGLMFAVFEERFGRPDLYLDDRQDLIDIARDHGWNAVQADGNADHLRAKL